MKDAYVDFLIQAYDDYCNFVSKVHDILIDYQDKKCSSGYALASLADELSCFDDKREKACTVIGGINWRTMAMKNYLNAKYGVIRMVGIKGFKMPESCYDCDLCYDMIGCSIIDVNWEHGFAFSSDFENRRSVHCPLVDLGEPLVLKPTEEQKKELIDPLEWGTRK